MTAMRRVRVLSLDPLRPTLREILGTIDWNFQNLSVISGPPGLVWKGAYSAGTTYDEDDAVSYGGSSWVSIQAANKGNTPEVGAWWDLLALKGTDGTDGADGADGEDGVDGLNGDDIWLPPQTGRYTNGLFIPKVDTNPISFGGNIVYAMPFYLPKDISYDAYIFRVNSGSANMLIALYGTETTSSYPSALVASTTSKTWPAAGGSEYVKILPLLSDATKSLPKGMYWIAFHMASPGNELYVSTIESSFCPWAFASTTEMYGVPMLRATLNWGTALPASFSSLSSITEWTPGDSYRPILVHLRKA